jgi:hypothetical protein
LKKIHYILVVGVTFFILLFLTLNKNSKTYFGNYHYQLWADKMGYHVYLPSLFIYDFDASKFPDKIADSTGAGFSFEGNKVVTKYPYGVALLQSPFWMIAHIFSSDKTGFSQAYANAVNFAAVTYLLVSLILLFIVLKRHQVKGERSILILLALTFGTNLIYYVIQEGGMSHIYSFFAFTGFVFFVTHPAFLTNKKLLIGAALFLGLILSIRTLNIVFAFTVLLLLYPNIKSLFKFSLYALPAMVLFYVPQAVYYYYLNGSLVMDSYKDEGFIHLFHPMIVEVLFAAQSGMFPYTPLMLLLVLSLFIKPSLHYVQLICFAIYLLIYASWHSYYLGCSYGHRAIIDILPIFILSVPSWMNKLSNKQVYILSGILLLGIYVNMTFVNVYDGCFYGKNEWDWDEYIQLFLRDPYSVFKFV